MRCHGNGSVHLPAAIGDMLSNVGTPSLLVDMQALEDNVSLMHRAIAKFKKKRAQEYPGKDRGVRLRPHAKALKSEAFIKWMLDRSDHGVQPVGVCCQTVAEAESAFRAGCKDILLTNQLWSLSKVWRLLSLKSCCSSSNIRVGCLIDDPANASFLAKRVLEMNETSGVDGGLEGIIKLDVFIEADAGQGRCGCSLPEEIVVVAKAIMEHPNELHLRGLHCYYGMKEHIRSREKRRKLVTDPSFATVHAAKEAMINAGLGGTSDGGFEIVTGGGTETFLYELDGGVFNEIQPGSYLMMDTHYADIEGMLMPEGKTGDSGSEKEEICFQNALFLHSTIISRKGKRRVIDAGSKACDSLCGPPKVVSLFDKKLDALLKETEGLRWELGGDEHGILHNVPDGLLPPGSTIQLVPSYCYSTVNLHDYYVCVRRDTIGAAVVENVWTIDARGPSP